MQITFLGHACFELSDGVHTLLVDPYLTGNALAAKTTEEVNPDFIFVTHAHGDHIGDTVSIAKRTGAVVYAVVELADGLLAGQGIKAARGNIGGRQATPFGSVKYLPAAHGSGVPGGLACGYLFEIGGKKIYHAGDTGLIADFSLLREEKLDAALLPIGDYYTMGPEDAARAAGMIGAELSIPMHYDTFPVIRQDPERFRALAAARGCKAAVLRPGESIRL